MDIKSKLRPFYVAKMLYELTDEDHYLTIANMKTGGRFLVFDAGSMFFRSLICFVTF